MDKGNVCISVEIREPGIEMFYLFEVLRIV